MPDFDIFGQELKKTLFAVLEISTLKFVYFQNFTENRKSLNLTPKMPSLGILVLKFEYNIVIVEIPFFKFL